MARGGKRENAGRKQSALTKKTRELAVSVTLDGGPTPLEFLVSVMRDVSLELNMRVDAAKAAASYVHPRLAAVEHSGNDKKPLTYQVVSGVTRDTDDEDVPQPTHEPDVRADH